MDVAKFSFQTRLASVHLHSLNLGRLSGSITSIIGTSE
jgi:hypothetical protein